MGSRLLLADDSITIQKVVGIIFANEDYELAVVDNGNAALEKAREILPDIMLVDALMPGKTGYEVCEEVRRDPRLAHTPILLLTGAFEPFDEEKARSCGADDFISKPFESQHLIEKVKKLLELGKARAEAPPAAAPAQPSVPPPAAAAVMEPVPGELSSIFLAGEGAPGEEAWGAVSLSEEEIVEGVPEDDLWGIVEAEEVPEGEVFEFGEVVVEEPAPAEGVEEAEPFVFAEEEEEAEGELFEFGEVVAEGVPGAAEGVEEVESFAFAGEGETAVFETGGAEEEPVEFGAETFPVGEEAFVFEEETGTREFEALPEEPFAVEPLFGEAALVEPVFAPEEEFVPAPEIAVPSPAPATISLTEEQLAAAISRISREVIERIAWEVVPDLAETIIREEIRKIKGEK